MRTHPKYESRVLQGKQNKLELRQQSPAEVLGIYPPPKELCIWCNWSALHQGGISVWYGDMISKDELWLISQAAVSDWTCPYPCCDLEVKHDPWLTWHPERARNMRLGGIKSSSLGCCKCTPRYGIHCQSSPHLTLSWCWCSLTRFPYHFSTYAASLWWGLKSDQ